MSRLHFEVRGKGRRLVLLHGWGLNVRVWDELGAPLAREFEVVAIDLPGHGRSPWVEAARTLAGQADLVKRTIEAAGATAPFSVLGWSFGGHLALELAASLGDAVDRLVLVGTTPRFTAGPDWPHGTSTFALQELADRLTVDYERTLTDFLELQVRASARGEEALAALRRALIAHGRARPEALAAGLEILGESDLRPALPRIGQPALVVAGQYDRITRPEASRALSRDLPHARYLELRRAGHAPFLSHGPQFLEAVRDFLLPAASAEAAAGALA